MRPKLAVPCFLLMLSVLAIVAARIESGAKEPDESVPIHVSGVVLDPDGKPIAAHVRFVSVFGNTVAESDCDPNGKFAFSFFLEDIDCLGVPGTIENLVEALFQTSRVHERPRRIFLVAE